MIAAVFEFASLGLFAACTIGRGLLGAETVPDLPFLQFGALGLVGFMVFQNYRQQKEAQKIINSQYDRMANLLSADTDAKVRLSEALEERPCLHGDSRIVRTKESPL
jgi:hypothetical protein